MPYSSDAVAPANAAGPTLSPADLPVASISTPTKPINSATARRVPMRSPKNTNAIRAVNNTVIALQMAPTAAGACCAPQANSRNGKAELSTPMAASIGQRCSGKRLRATHKNGNNTVAPSARRISTNAAAPKCGAATRMNRNEQPHTIPRNTSSSGVRQSRTPSAGCSDGCALMRAPSWPAMRRCTRVKEHRAGERSWRGIEMGSDKASAHIAGATSA